jgi:hypothetical protein
MMKAIQTGAVVVARTLITTLGLLSLGTVGAFAQEGHSQTSTSQRQS